MALVTLIYGMVQYREQPGQRLADVYVKPSTRDRLREAKQGKTYDQFLTELLEKIKQ